MRLPQSCSQSPSIHIVSFIVLLLFTAMLPLRLGAATRQLQCSPANLRFGSVEIGQLQTQLVSVTNTGQTSAQLSAASVSSSEFSFSGLALPVALAPGQSASFNVIFAPVAKGWSGGRVTISSDASNPSLPIQLQGTGVTSDSLIATPASLSFGQVAVGSQAALSVVLTNDRTSKETLNSLQAQGNGFSISGPSFPLVLKGGQSATLTITFSPQSAGAIGGDIFIAGPNLSIPMTGTGTMIGQLTLSPASLSFGNVDVGSSSSQGSTITATGGTVTVSSARSSNAQFAVAGVSFPLTLNAGQSASFSVIFSPTASATDTASLVLTSNASNSPATESLSGVGVVPQYSVNLSWSPSTSSVAGYNVYRGLAAGSYTKLNCALDTTSAYTDNTVVAGTTYYYAATAVNSSGEESAYSTPVEVAIP